MGPDSPACNPWAVHAYEHLVQGTATEDIILWHICTKLVVNLDEITTRVARFQKSEIHFNSSLYRRQYRWDR